MVKKYPLGVVYLLTVLAMLFWGWSFVWMKQVFELGFRPFTVVFFRLVIASILMIFWSKIIGNVEVIKKSDYKLIFFLAFAEPFCYFLGESFGMLYMTPSLASIIISTIPLVTPVLAWMFINERVSIYEIIGLVVSFSGVLFLVVEDLSLGGQLIGFLLMFFAVLSGTTYGIILKKLAGSYSAITITKYQTIIGMGLFMPLFFIFDFRVFMSGCTRYAASGFVYIVLLGVFASSLAFIFLTIAVSRIGIVRSYIFTYLIPVFTAVIAYFVMHEPFTVTKILAMCVVIAGLLVSQGRLVKQWYGGKNR